VLTKLLPRQLRRLRLIAPRTLLPALPGKAFIGAEVHQRAVLLVPLGYRHGQPGYRDFDVLIGRVLRTAIG
jgi:hypothetical protein